MNSFELFFEEDDGVLSIRELARKRKVLRDSSNPLEQSDIIFMKYFRLSKEAFIMLLKDVEPKRRLQKRLSSKPNILKLAAALRFFAEGSYQKVAGNDFLIALAQPTFSLVLKEILNVLEENICAKWITFNFSAEEKRECKMYFYDKSKIPGVIGCVDGTHNRIIKPKEELQHLYYNRKGYFSINVMVVCDHQMKIRYINGKHPGSSHDSLVWNLSKLKNQLQRVFDNGDKNSWLLGDVGYPLQPILLTPFRAPVSGSPQFRYNDSHSTGRNIVERTIGVLKNRFRCLIGARQLHYGPEKVTQIINVCAALDNICIHYRVDLLPTPDVLDFAETIELDQEEDGRDTDDSEAQIIRNMIDRSL